MEYIGIIYWYYILVLYIGIIYWYYILVLYIGIIYWYYILVLYIGIIDWYYILVLYISIIYWYYILVLYIGITYIYIHGKNLNFALFKLTLSRLWLSHSCRYIHECKQLYHVYNLAVICTVTPVLSISTNM